MVDLKRELITGAQEYDLKQITGLWVTGGEALFFSLQSISRHSFYL
ncbi:hypothetical protein ABIE54_002065 [Chitinophagaceae bacterium OAS944]